MKVSVTTSIFLLWSICTLGQDFDQVQLETIQVTDRIYMVSGGGGNIGVLVGEDGILLIDTMFAELEDKIRKEISELSIGPIRFILNTNWHYDHVMGNAALAKDQATIIAHHDTRRRMLSEQVFPMLETKIPPYPESALPVITLEDSMILYFNGEEIHASHVESAHSDADLAFFFKKANVLHSGDIIFSNGYPFIDTHHGGSIDGMIAAADKLLGLIDDETKIIPGHGPLLSREMLEEYKQMLVSVRDRIAREIKDGKSLEETIASKPTSDLDEKWNQSMPAEGFVQKVYESLTKQ